jgi:REP element-mobilizing transposase RayT
VESEQGTPARHRRSIRLAHHDYQSSSAYFVTICTRARDCVLGEVEDADVRLTPMGKIVRNCWLEIPDHVEGAELDAFVVMPNHLHAILLLGERLGHSMNGEEFHGERFGQARPRTLSGVVRSYKAATTRRVRTAAGNQTLHLWQRGYFERVIRSAGELTRFRRYIEANPSRWQVDPEYRPR